MTGTELPKPRDDRELGGGNALFEGKKYTNMQSGMGETGMGETHTLLRLTLEFR